MIIFAGKSSLRRLLRDRRRTRALRMPEQQYTQPLERSDKTIGGENEDRQRRNPVGNHVIVFQNAKPLAQEDDQDCSQDSAGNSRAAANHGHDETGHHQGEIEVLRRYDVDDMRHQRASSTAIGGTENKGGKPKMSDVDTERRRRNAILTHEMEGPTVKAPSHLIGNQ